MEPWNQGDRPPDAENPVSSKARKTSETAGAFQIHPRQNKNNESGSPVSPHPKIDIYLLNITPLRHRRVGTHHAMKGALVKEKQNLRKRKITEMFSLYAFKL